MAKKKEINIKEIIHRTWNDGATWEDIEELTGCHRKTIQRRLKGEEYTDSKGNTRLKGGHYTTKEGYERFLSQVRKNVKARKKMSIAEPYEKEEPALQLPISDKSGIKLPETKQLNKILLVDTSSLFKIKSEGKSFSDLTEEYQLVYIPQRCIDELQHAAGNRSRFLRKETAEEILREIISKKFDENIIVIYTENCNELLVDNTQSAYKFRDRTKEVVAALCWLFRENCDANITCLTSTKQVAQLACWQKFPHTVTIRYKSAARLD